MYSFSRNQVKASHPRDRDTRARGRRHGMPTRASSRQSLYEIEYGHEHTALPLEKRTDVVESSKDVISLLRDFTQSSADEQLLVVENFIYNCNRLYRTLSVQKSPLGGYGVYSRGDIKAGTRVGGCYEGVVIVTENKDGESVLPFEMQKSEYVFSFGVDDNGTMCTAFVDALSPFKCSVLRFVNSSTSEKSANVESHIDKGRVYLVTSKDVKDGEEFFMFYGWAYWFKRASLLR
jgi:hypothetical protein